MNKSPWLDLARSVQSELYSAGQVRLNIKVLVKLFEAMYFASLRTEESEPITAHIVFLDPRNPDPKPPIRIRNDRWQYIPFSEPVLLTDASLVKLAKASDPRTSSFVVYPDDKGILFIWGLVDQGNSYFNYATYSAESGFTRPGSFQASIVGSGRLVAYVGSSQIAEINLSQKLTKYSDVLRRGPVSERLALGIEESIEAASKDLILDASGQKAFIVGLKNHWIETLCRILLRIQSYKHGGALLITPDRTLTGLNVKHSLDYPRVCSAIQKVSLLRARRHQLFEEIFDEYVRPREEFMPVRLYLENVVCEDELVDARSELDGAIWFASLLTRVDGLLLMTPDLVIHGFGVEITYTDEPGVHRASDHTAKRLRKVDYNHYGTRHRSMMRYCFKVPGSVGFVISQDGDLRVITKVGAKLVIWENIRLRIENFREATRGSSTTKKAARKSER